MSEGNDSYRSEFRGPLGFMARNGVAANLLILGVVAAGVLSLGGIPFDMYAPIPFHQVEVSVAYPGATPDEVEESIVAKIEEQVSGMDSVKAVNAVAAAGMASVRVEIRTGADIAQALRDIESAVGGIRSFPNGAERPRYRELTNQRSIVRLVVYGSVPERTLKEIAFGIEDELAALPGVTDVDTTGTRDYEISIEVPQRNLRALGLTLQDVAAAVRRSSLNLSGGEITTRDSKVRVRTLEQSYDQQDFEEVVVLAGGDGALVRLGDIAQVRDGFQQADLVIRHENKPAVFVEVFRAGEEQLIAVAETVRNHVEGVLVPALPPGVAITVWNDESEFFDTCVNLLLKNGALGLLLVFVALALFLEIRASVWVAVGIAVSAIGALAVVLAMDLTIDSNALFAFVLALGIVVDDAIVVAEHVWHERQQGASAAAAAVRGVRRIAGPLTFAVLTSMVAFSPLMFLPGGQGEILFVVAVVLIAMLAVSLVESLFVLPYHLSRLPGPDHAPSASLARHLRRTQAVVQRQLQRFVAGPLAAWLYFATAHPAVIIAGCVGLLTVSLSLLPAGIVPTIFLNQVEGDLVTASLEMPDGTTSERTYEVARELEEAGHRAIERLERERSADAPRLLEGVIATVGQGARMEGGGLVPSLTLNPKGNIATVEFKLLSAERRDVSAGAFMDAWREEVGVLPYARALSFSSDVLSFGNPVEIILSHPDGERLGVLADAVVGHLRQLRGVFDVQSDHAPGVKEIQIELRSEARTLGLTAEGMAFQVREAFFGAEAVRLQHGREEVKVFVRLPSRERDAIADIERYIVRLPNGNEVPLRQVAELREGTSPLTIRRKGGQRIVTVTANVDQAVITGSEATGTVVDTVLPDLMASNPGLTYLAGGEAQQQIESLDSLVRSFVLAMFLIYALLAIPLRSYVKPLIVMAAIPFGMIGAIFGHLVIGIAFSFTSIMGFVGLSGVVINDSLVMIDFINQHLKEGVPARQAIIEGAKQRFRPIMLTSVTTFLGFTPLILERSIHAKFLVPFAASLGFGTLITTALLMLLVPALVALLLRGEIGLSEEAPAGPVSRPSRPASSLAP